MTENRSLCTFLAHGLLFGVAVADVQEVAKGLGVTPVPLAPPSVIGLVNLRGQIVSAIDLRRRLGLPERDPADPRAFVIVRAGHGPVCLVVDEVGDVLSVDEAAFEERPQTVEGVAKDLIAAPVKLADRLLLVLDTARVVDVAVEAGAPGPSAPPSAGKETP